MISDVGLLGNVADRNPALMATPQWEDSTYLPLQADWVILYLESDTFGSNRNWIHQRRHELLTQGYQQVDQAGTLVLLGRGTAIGH